MKNTNLINARKKKKLTQGELAEMLGYKGKQAVSNWENSWILPPLEVALRISQILEEDIFFLFGEEVQENHTNKEED